MTELEKILKIGLAAILLLCLLDMPYGYYMFVRSAAMIGFSVLAYFSYKRDEQVNIILFIGLALIFQPFSKIAFGRLIWNIIDLAVAVYLIYSVSERKENVD